MRVPYSCVRLNYTCMQGLHEIINVQTGGDPSSAVNTPDQPASGLVTPDAGAAPAVPPTHPPVAEPASTSTPEPSADPPSDPPAAVKLTGFDFRGSLSSQLGFDSSEFESDEQAFEAFSSLIGEAATTINDPRYQEFLKSQSAATPAETPPATPVDPMVPEASVSPESKESGIQVAEISKHAQQARDQGWVTQNDKGIWESSHPNLQSFADEYNNASMVQRTNALSFTSDPVSFVKNIVAEVSPESSESAVDNDEITALKETVARLEQQITQQHQASEHETLSTFAQSPEVRNQETKALTPYGQKYVEWERSVVGDFPQLEGVARHEKVLERMKLAGISPASQEPEPTQEPEPRKSFVQNAAASANGNGRNRLKDYAGNAPAKEPVSLTGPSGFPDLKKIVASQSSPIT